MQTTCPKCKSIYDVNLNDVRLGKVYLCQSCNTSFKAGIHGVSSTIVSAQQNTQIDSTKSTQTNIGSAQLANIAPIFYILAVINLIGGIAMTPSIGIAGLAYGISAALFAVFLGRILDLLWNINNNLKK